MSGENVGSCESCACDHDEVRGSREIEREAYYESMMQSLRKKISYMEGQIEAYQYCLNCRR